MTTVTISLPEALKAFVDSQIARGDYGNVSEYFRSLLRDAQAKERDARLEALLIEGLESGEAHAATPQFWAELKADALKRVVQRSGGKPRA